MKKVAKNRAREIRALKRMKDTEIDLADIPEIKDWSKAVVGRFYRPIKKSLTIRLDADVLAWVKAEGRFGATRHVSTAFCVKQWNTEGDHNSGRIPS